MKKLLIVLLPFLLSGCSYKLTEEIYFHQNKTADINLSIDFAKSLDSKNKDMIIQMVSGGIKGFAQTLSGGKTKVSEKSLGGGIEQLFSQAKDSLKPVLLEISLDTVAKLNKDSILIAFSKKDTLHQYSAQQLEITSTLAYYLIHHAKIRMQMDIPANIMKFEIAFKNISWDSLKLYHFDAFRKGGELANIDEKNAKIAAFFPQWEGNEITRSNNSFDVIDLKKGQPLDEQTKQAWENSNLIINYHFPSKIISCSNKLFKKTNGGLTAIFNETFLMLYKTKPSVSTIIKY